MGHYVVGERKMKNSSVYPTTENNGVNSGEPGITLQQYAAIHLKVPNNKKHHLGYFDCPQIAHEAYLVAKRQLHTTCTI